MCRILATTRPYDGSMSHGGIVTKARSLPGKNLFHEHLPIQSKVDDESIIETDFWTVLFNGEILDSAFHNDLDYIKELFSQKDLKDITSELGQRDGFYSFICYNKICGDMFAFTDPLGKKQLYYDGFSISSEIRPLLKGPIDRLFMSRTIKFGYVTDDSTPYSNIKRVLPNKVYRFDHNLSLISVAQDNIYDFVARKRNTELPQLLQQSVDNRLKGHEDISLLLSGGVDSSIIYYHILNSRPGLFDKTKEVKTYCIDNEEDLKYARMMYRDTGSIKISHNLDAALIAQEMPLDLGSMEPQYNLFKSVDSTVILTGDGADEIFGGYRRMSDYDSQLSDIFDELVYYHNVRLDRMSMAHTKEVRSPFMSIPIIEYGLALDYDDRKFKKHLRESYKGKICDEILNRPKEALKTKEIRKTGGVKYRSGLVELWRELCNR